MPGPVKNRLLRTVLLALGFFFLGMAFVGVILPFVPTTGPVILAGFLFSKSSERFDRWLAENRFFGMIVRDWRAGRGFSIRSKVIAVVAIALTFSVTILLGTRSPVVRALLAVLAVAIAIYVVSRPTKRTALVDAEALG